MAKFKEISAIIVIFILSTNSYVANAKPNTRLVTKICNGYKYYGGAGVGSSIVYVQNDVTVQTSSNGYNYYSRSPWDTDIAYGHGACNGMIPANDCNACMLEADNQIRNGCPRNTGAQVQLQDCRIRYEIYPFTE